MPCCSLPAMQSTYREGKLLHDEANACIQVDKCFKLPQQDFQARPPHSNLCYWWSETISALAGGGSRCKAESAEVDFMGEWKVTRAELGALSGRRRPRVVGRGSGSASIGSSTSEISTPSSSIGSSSIKWRGRPRFHVGRWLQ